MAKEDNVVGTKENETFIPATTCSNSKEDLKVDCTSPPVETKENEAQAFTKTYLSWADRFGDEDELETVGETLGNHASQQRSKKVQVVNVHQSHLS